MSETPFASSLAGIGRWPHSGIPGAPTGPAFRSTITLEASQSSSGVVDARGEVVDVVEHERRPLVREERRVGRGDLHHRAVGAQVAVEHDERAARLERVGGGADHVGVLDRRSGDVLAHRLAGDRDRVEVQEVAELRHHGRQAARVEEVLHQVGAGRLQVHEQRRRRGSARRRGRAAASIPTRPA